MARGNWHVHRAIHAVRLAHTAHSDTCEWPHGCTRGADGGPAPSRWYYLTAAYRWSMCDYHCPAIYRTDPIPIGGDD